VKTAIAKDGRLPVLSSFPHLANDQPNHYPPQGNRYGGILQFPLYKAGSGSVFLELAYQQYHSFICENRSPISFLFHCVLGLLIDSLLTGCI
jgi:hypothetical protein